jgi:MFS family permease
VRSLLRRIIHEDPTFQKISFSIFIDRFGNGLLISVLTIYFSFHVGIGPARTALALSIGAAFALCFSIPAGHIIDLFGQKIVVILAMLVNGIAIFSLVYVKTFLELAIALTIDAIATVFSRNAQLTMIARISAPEKAAHNRAYTRSVSNLGIGLGTFGSGLALSLNSTFAYRTVISLDAVTFLIAALLYFRVPYLKPTLSAKESFDWTIFKDHRYIKAVLMSTIANIHFVVQNVGLPIWVVKYTHAPRWWVAALFIINTASIVLFQVKVSKFNQPLNKSFKTYFYSALLLFIACALYATAAGPSAKIAALVLTLGMAAQVIAEMFISMIHWNLSFDLADPTRQASYYGIWNVGTSLTDIIGPSIITFAIVSGQKVGWLLVGVGFVINSLAYKFIIKGEIKN